MRPETPLIVLAVVVIAFVVLLIALSACATTPTPEECEARADKADWAYGADFLENVLIRDSLIRECLGERR